MNSGRKAIWGWALYDWANSAFATTVMAGFFPIFFKQYWSYGTDVNLSTAQLGFGNSVASMIVALTAPVLGAIADKGGAKKRFLIAFAYLGVLMTAALFWVGKGQWALAIFVYAMGIIGFSGANTFYDALLPSVAGEKQIDWVSGFGFSLGYLGGGLLFLINVVMTLMPHRFGLPDASAAVRWSFVSVALWWGGFTLMTIWWVPEDAPADHPRSPLLAVSAGFRQLYRTFGKIRHLKTVMLFLAAYWFYIDGVGTVIRMAVAYGLSIGFDANDLIVALLVVQFVGFPAALGFGKLGQAWDIRKAIYLALGIYLVVTLWATRMSAIGEFFILAAMIGCAQGGIQALSRSYYARLIPANQAGEYYGFFNMLGKFAAILGPSIMGIVGLIARKMLMPTAPTPEQIEQVGRLASRWSIASIAVLFVVGALLFFFVDEKTGRKEAQRLTQLA